MVEKRKGYDCIDIVCFAIAGLIFIGVIFRSVEATTSIQEIVRSVGGVVILALLLAWRYAGSRVSARQEGIVTLVVGFVTIGLLLILVPADASVFDGELIAAYGAFFLYGIVRLIGPDIPFSTRMSGGVLLIVGTVMIEVGLMGGDMSVGLLSWLRTILLGGVVTLFGAAFVFRPNAVEQLEN